MGARVEEQLPVGRRLLAAGGAAFVAATIVNPLDVVKTRMQAHAAASSSGRPAPVQPSTLYEAPHRHLFHQLSYNDIIKTVHQDPPATTQRRFAVGCGSAVLLPPEDVAWADRRWGICEAPRCSSCPSEGLNTTSSSRTAASSARAGLSGGYPRAGLGAPGTALSTLPMDSMWEACRTIMRQEGLPVLWRGTTTSLLIAVPMVGIYMPLYDHLLQQYQPMLGAAAPIAAGTSARTMACFAVAPFELLRTRFQAQQGRHATLRDTIATVARTAHGSSSSSSTAAGAVRALRGVPHWWTGFGATLVRDVPFSALYWAMVEPLRSAMLPKQSHFCWPGLHQAHPNPRPPTPAAAAAAAAAPSNVASSGISSGLQASAVGVAHPVPSGANTSGSSSSSSSGGGSSSGAALPTPRFHHSQQEILLANMVSGFVAGGLAAGATTPFDVVKTRHQIAAGGHGSSRRSVLGTLRAVHAQEGWEGLFRGVKPRSYRAAPACAIVISVYELLKNWLAE